MDEMRFRTQQSPRNEPPMNTLVSSPRNGTRLPQPGASHDPRTSLPRRFTTESGRVPTLSNIATTQRGPEQPQDYATMHKVQLIEKKQQEFARIREQKRRFEVEMQKLDQVQRREEQELAQLQEDLTRMNMGGHQSEPTTPPEYRETASGFPTMFSKPNRYSMSSLTSPPGIFGSRPGRSGSQLASPQAGNPQSRFAYDDQLPTRSVPGSRRNSDEDEKEEAVRQDPTSHRSTNALNRYSMPVTRSKSGLYDMGLDQTNTARFLFGEDDSTPKDSPFGHGSAADENFPTLVRQDNQMSVSSLNGAAAGQNNSRPSTIRHSLDLKFLGDNSADTSASAASSHVMASPPKLQSSFSANDVSTIKNTASVSMMGSNANNHAQQHFHNHNASLGRIPAGAMSNRHSRELSNDNGMAGGREQPGAFQSIQTAFQGSTAPFGPGIPAQAPLGHAPAGSSTPSSTAASVSSYGGFYGGTNFNSPSAAPSTGAYGVPLLAMSMHNMNINGGNPYPPQNFTGYGALYNHGGQVRDSQARVIQHRRQLDNEAMSRYQNLPIESVGGQIYELCKDQHGCRYLQKQLEERNPEHVHMIWLETNQHVIELMTDPFGNYLCQKLLEYCNDEERTVLIQNASQNMVQIALNQHGTRALQKMIEFITTPTQVQIIIDALRFRVVELIQDLNGNHVIQKCLNKLSAHDAQFIFDAVGTHCVDVGTHRHGCCVLQRCIDHASGDQKIWLIQKITEHAPTLVQDPFGNYVVQYIIDLNVPEFTEPVVDRFRGHICQLSRHKFSSNVIEKCLRCAENNSKDMIVEELLKPGEIERLIRDSFANYVIQTALEYATPVFKFRLIDAIRPILPTIRQTPYGRRIAAKVTMYDQRGGSANSSGQATPSDSTGGQIPLRGAHGRTLSNNQSALAPGAPYTNGLPVGGMTNGTVGGRGGGPPPQQYQASTAVTVPPPAQPQARLPQAYPFAQSRSSGNVSSENGETQWL